MRRSGPSTPCVPSVPCTMRASRRWRLRESLVTTQIFFDTYAERYEDMREFFRALPRILAKDGVFSFFNGLAPFNPFFHGVACEFVKCELDSIGLD